MIALALKFFGGISLRAYLIAGAIALFGIYTVGVYQAGRNYQESIDDAASLRLENARLAAAEAAAKKNLADVNAIQQNDVKRAKTLEGELAELRKQINETPANDNPSLSAPSVGRVRRTK